jgi:hypothetical protein
MARRIEIPEGLTAPEGEWEVWADDVSIVGERHRLDDFGRFMDGFSTAMGKGLPCGVRLEREPTNPHDPYAVKVNGFWVTQGLFSAKGHVAHLGYLSGKLAYKLGQELGPDGPISAELVALELDDDGEPNVVIHILELA